jgi:hypothetical protein
VVLLLTVREGGGLDRLGFSPQWGGGFSPPPPPPLQNVLTHFRAHPESYRGILSLGVQRPGCEVTTYVPPVLSVWHTQEHLYHLLLLRAFHWHCHGTGVRAWGNSRTVSCCLR